MAEVASDDVCYRHPDRQSWTLCGRCGRTICAECQIGTPQGTRCPDCIREAGGEISWQKVGTRPAAPPRPRRVTRETPTWLRRVLGVIAPGTGIPVLSFGALALVLVMFILGFVSGGALPELLAMYGGVETQPWRYLTAWTVYPASPAFILSIILSSVFFVLIGPGVEQLFGRRRFAVVFLAGAVVAASFASYAGAVGAYAFGLSGPLLGLFGAYLILVWHDPQARVRVFIMLAINVLISLVYGGLGLPQLIGGVVGGAAATYLLRRHDDTVGGSDRRPLSLIAGGCAALIVLGVLLGFVR